MCDVSFSDQPTLNLIGTCYLLYQWGPPPFRAMPTRYFYTITHLPCLKHCKKPRNWGPNRRDIIPYQMETILYWEKSENGLYLLSNCGNCPIATKGPKDNKNTEPTLTPKAKNLVNENFPLVTSFDFSVTVKKMGTCLLPCTGVPSTKQKCFNKYTKYTGAEFLLT
jgi:hypothetical protein